MISAVSDPVVRPPRQGRTDTREAAELRALKERQPELADAVDMHIELVDLHRRIQGRVPLPWFELSAEILQQHQANGRPLLRFEDIPLELTDLRLILRQTSDVLRRHGALDDEDFQKIQAVGRDMTLVTVVGEWYRAAADRQHTSAPVSDSVMDQVLTLAMRPFLSRCAEVLQQRSDLATWTHPHCALCGGEPDFAVITPAAERHLICSRCSLRWKFEPLTCPYCRNDDRARITSFATQDGRYRVYACDVCHRYLKAYDGRRASRPVMPMVDLVATLPLDAAAIQRGYTS
jgi:formate dehydrogenase maturation protein FdhE